jgi:hypothetical protein
MSITITGAKQLATSSNSVLCSGQSQASIAFFFRYDGDPAASNATVICWRQFYSSLYISMSGSAAEKLKASFFWVPTSGSSPLSQLQFTVGAVYHIAMTYDQGSQKVWVNASPSSMSPSATGTTQSISRAFLLGGNDYGSNSGCIYTIHGFGIWNGYTLTAQDVIDLRDGTKAVADVGATATTRVSWSLAGATGATPVVGDAGLANGVGSTAYNLSSISGSGSVVYSDPLAWVPSVTIAEPIVGTSGKTTFIFPKNIVGGTPAIPTSLDAPLSISVNGVPRGNLTPIVASGVHTYAMFSNPVAVSAGDVVRVDAPRGAIFCNSGFTEVATAVTALNRVGKSMVRPDGHRPDREVGYNLSYFMAGHNSLCPLLKNRALAAGSFSSVTAKDANAKPTALSQTYSTAQLIEPLPANNGIDSTGYPGPVGLFAVGWDDLGGTSFALASGDAATTVVTEVAGYNNAGSGGVGKVRVFNVQRAGGSTQVGVNVLLTMSCPGLSPAFDNLVVHGPEDFTPGTPTILDRADRYAFSEVFLDRVRGAGCFRMQAWDPQPESSQVDVEHLIDETRFTYGWGNYTYYKTLGFDQASPYSTATYPYFYWHSGGQKYNCNLTNNINASQTDIDISDAATAPVFANLRLFADSEEMQVVGVSGTTVTVKRGANGTTAATHSAGTIQCGYRVPSVPLGTPPFSNAGVVVLRTQQAHNLVTGQRIAPTGGGWPNLATTSGKTIFPPSSASPAFVVGTNLVVCKFGLNDGYTGSGVTVSGTTNLNPSNLTLSPCQANIDLPGGPQTPYAVLCKAANTVGIRRLFITIPQCATNETILHIARKVRDNIDPSIEVWLEYANEPWNFSVPNYLFTALTYGIHPGQTPLAYYVKRASEVGDLFRLAFDEGGRNRSGQVHLYLNAQCVNPSPAMLDFAAAQNPPLRIDGVAIAPYLEPGWADAQTNAAYARIDHQQAIDLYTANLWYKTDSFTLASFAAAWSSYLASYTASTGYACQLVAYEGGVEIIHPGESSCLGTVSVTSGSPTVAGSGSKFLLQLRAGDTIKIKRSSDNSYQSYTVLSIATDTSLTLAANYADATESSRPYSLVIPNQRKKDRDAAYDPNFYIAEQDLDALVEKVGIQSFNIFELSGDWYQGFFLWPHYHSHQQLAGRGDGSDGLADNRLTLAQTKASTVNQDLANVSVRGRAWKDWNVAAKKPARRRRPRYGSFGS